MKHWTPDDDWEPPRRHQEMAERLSQIREQNLWLIRLVAFALGVATIMLLI